jgi:hypothetical protein
MNAQPNDKTEIVLAMWRCGADTTDIAQRTRLSEALVYSIIAHRPQTVRPSLKIPYAGAPQ